MRQPNAPGQRSRKRYCGRQKWQRRRTTEFQMNQNQEVWRNNEKGKRCFLKKTVPEDDAAASKLVVPENKMVDWNEVIFFIIHGELPKTNESKLCFPYSVPIFYTEIQKYLMEYNLPLDWIQYWIRIFYYYILKMRKMDPLKMSIHGTGYLWCRAFQNICFIDESGKISLRTFIHIL
jgi:hypothetical protein